MVKQIGLVDRGNVGWERKEFKLVRRFWHEQPKEGMHVCSVVFNLFAIPLTASSCPWSFTGRSTGVQLLLGCHFLLQSKEQGCYLLRWRKSVGRAGLREKLDSNFGGRNYS